MQFKLLNSFVAVTALLASVEAINYEAFSSTNTCSGPAFGCTDDGGVCCGGMPTGFGFSAQFENLPSGTQGQGYNTAAGCSSFLFNVFGPGTKCWNGGGGSRAIFLNWFHSASSRRDMSREIARAPSGNCTASLAYFKYIDNSNVEKKIKVPVNNDQAAQKIADHYGAKDFDTLSKYESY